MPGFLSRRARLRAALLPVLLAGCMMKAPNTGVVAPGAAGLSPVAFTALPGWSPAIAQTGLASFVRSCRALAVMPEDQTLGGDGVAARLAGKAGLWRGVCAAARAVSPGDPAAAQTFFQTYFVPYEAAGPTRFSGYFEPVYAGSEIRLRGYAIPLYGKPRNLVRANLGVFRDSTGHQRIVGRLRYGKLVPFYSRARIERGAIAREAHVVAWLRDPVDTYMVQVQGSARLRLPDGTLIDLGFDGTNGRAYTPIGKLMVQKGYLQANDVSIQSISAWLRAHPAEASTLMDANKNYVFMKRVRDVPDGLGAPGALGVPLTPEGSIAVDEKAIPLGAPVFVAANTMDRLMTAQDIDVGAKGAAGAQIFFGIGRNAATLAGATDDTGRLFVLLPRPIASASATSAGGPTS
ncbi:murein transglycosylase A [Acidiphilium iwatense]|uniref:peptidoglycan lytic exotransglycosylase n=2 Tax=Acidiphilium iwatense TaxID=768198 RepID=A0ABS9DUA4_9PROT|nr:murein transglycosylase A [Acidiphilium sp. AL]MCF3945370.1 murein transglycosylase A [Acidiphilium iwatense]